VLFDLDAEGDMTIENELQSMTPEQRSTQAMNLLLYGQYTGPNTRTQQGNFAENALYSFLTSTLNSWAANNIRGVDLSFGVNQYEQTVGGQDSQTTSYSYQVSKSLFDNRFKIVVGGNYTTDASADENFAENLISDVSFEYMLKQTNSMSMLVKLFRHSDFDNILEGEVSETGVGFVMKRRMENLSRFFRVRWGKRKPRKEEAKTDSVTTPADEHSDDTIAPQPYEF
jgi:translocation and assembly module TamB